MTSIPTLEEFESVDELIALQQFIRATFTKASYNSGRYKNDKIISETLMRE